MSDVRGRINQELQLNGVSILLENTVSSKLVIVTHERGVVRASTINKAGAVKECYVIYSVFFLSFYLSCMHHWWFNSFKYNYFYPSLNIITFVSGYRFASTNSITNLELVEKPDSLVGVRPAVSGDGTALEVLIKWDNLPDYEATWEDFLAVQTRFPAFHLEDKVTLLFTWYDKYLLETLMDGSLIIGGVSTRTHYMRYFMRWFTAK